MQYELFYLVGERQEANLDTIKKDVEEILVSEKAKLLDPEVLEKRKLAYEIKHQRRGTYVTRRFELPENEDGAETEKESAVEKITKKLNLTGNVLRFIIVRADELPDLGAIERRKSQEMNKNQASQKPQKQKEQPRTKIQSTKETEEKKKEEPELTEAQAAPSAPKTETKEDAKDIDKQLDKLLDI
ncbi:MAG TPA: 30S ribosomal protein S6 [Candidatus Moranbacteria bacterium]|jgi:ribosomal protein S6|nr:30S ribosomal protein S6 [Candidatus Moranbacteria bacterium]HPX94493.1 30S ribosomal protein S6 [Candidatus Moranbacteria bacterium]HQB59747.1 30S ribosomal protein S6 [Candidatus Moranbacteria bacterium]